MAHDRSRGEVGVSGAKGTLLLLVDAPLDFNHPDEGGRFLRGADWTGAAYKGSR